MSDFIDTLDRLGTGIYTITRTTEGTLTNGRYTPGTQGTFVASGVLVPLTGIELQRLPEGMRSRDCKLFLTSVVLKTKESGFDPDQLAFNGKQYQVYHNEPWNESGNYFKVLLVQVLS